MPLDGHFLNPRSSSTISGAVTSVHRLSLFGPHSLLSPGGGRRREMRSIAQSLLCISACRLSSTLRRRVHGSWPAAWTRGGVELSCKSNVSYYFPFVESACKVNDGPSYPRVKECAPLWTGLVSVHGCETLVLLLSTVSRCECMPACLVAGRLCLEPTVPDEEKSECTNDTWVMRVSSTRSCAGRGSLGLMRPAVLRERRGVQVPQYRLSRPVPVMRLTCGQDSRRAAVP